MSERHEWTDERGTRWRTTGARTTFLLPGSDREATASEFQEKRAVRHEALRLAARVKALEAGERQRQIELLHAILIAAANDRVENRTDSAESYTKAIDAKLAELRKEGAP